MKITRMGGDPPPVFLPLQRTPASPFLASLRDQARAEVQHALSGEQAASAGADQAGLNAALQQSLLTRSGSTRTSSAWGALARSIGGHYLSADAAEVFSRQMELESAGFDPDVIYGRRRSAAGAEGIAQLMPSSYPDVNRLDPVASLYAAAETMRGNLQTFGGDLRMALAAYNAGAGRVRDAVARSGADWEGDLPEETRVYLRSLLGGRNE